MYISWLIVMQRHCGSICGVCVRERGERKEGGVCVEDNFHRQHSIQSSAICRGLIPMSSLQTGMWAHTIIPSPTQYHNIINNDLINVVATMSVLGNHPL